MKKIITLLALIVISTLADAQITWNMTMNVAGSSFGNMHPRIVTNAAGDPLILWNHSMNAMFSRWNGTGFTAPVALNPAPLMIAGASWMGPDIAAKGDTVYVVFKQMPEADTSSHIYLIRSFDGGISFSTPFQVDNIGDSISRFPTLTIDDEGHPIVAFMKFDNTFMDSRWVLTRSNDFGSTFITDFKASGLNGSMEICDCCPGAIANSGDTVIVLYRDNNNNIRDMWGGVSVDNGNSISSGLAVDQNNWQIFSCTSSGADGVIAGDSLHAVYMSGANGDTRVYYSVTALSSTGSTGNEITGSLPGLNVQNYPRMASDEAAIGIAWKQNVSGNDQAVLKFTNNIASGFPLSYDTVGMSGVENVDLAIDNGNIFVVWEDNNSGTVKYRSGTYSIFTGIGGEIKNQVSVTSTITNNLLEIKGSPLNAQLSVSDALGRIVIKKILKQDYNQVGLQQLQNGIYFLSIENENQQFLTTKIIKY